MWMVTWPDVVQMWQYVNGHMTRCGADETVCEWSHDHIWCRCDSMWIVTWPDVVQMYLSTHHIAIHSSQHKWGLQHPWFLKTIKYIKLYTKNVKYNRSCGSYCVLPQNTPVSIIVMFSQIHCLQPPGVHSQIHCQSPLVCPLSESSDVPTVRIPWCALLPDYIDRCKLYWQVHHLWYNFERQKQEFFGLHVIFSLTINT